MMSARGNRDFGTKKPVWQSDASARWLALLPELVLSIVATTCMSVLLCYPDVEDFGLLVVAMLATQVYVQVVLYACTYIARFQHAGFRLQWLRYERGQPCVHGFHCDDGRHFPVLFHASAMGHRLACVGDGGDCRDEQLRIRALGRVPCRFWRFAGALRHARVCRAHHEAIL